MSVFALIDILCVAGGVFLLVAPNKAYNFGRREEDRKEPPKNWPLHARILGVAFVVFGIVFIVLERSA